MIASFIITFREALEAALVVGIILSYLARIKQTKYNNIVYIGIVSGLLASIIGALLFINIAGGFSGRAEQIFEGKDINMLPGVFIFMKENAVHSLKAEENTAFILSLS